MFLRSVDYSRTLNALYKGESAAQEAIVSLTGFLDLLPMVLERNAVPLDGTLFELLEKIMEPYEYVVIDASSVGRSSDVLRLNKLANNVLFVVRYDATPLPALQDAIEKLDKSGVRVLGCVVNETQSLGTFQFYPERTAVSNTPKKNENTDEKETGGSLPEDLLRPADGQEKAADWKPSGAGSQSVLDELTDDLYQTKGGLSDNEAMWELLRMGKDGSWKQTDPENRKAKPLRHSRRKLLPPRQRSQRCSRPRKKAASLRSRLCLKSRKNLPQQSRNCRKRKRFGPSLRRPKLTWLLWSSRSRQSCRRNLNKKRHRRPSTSASLLRNTNISIRQDRMPQ